MQNFVMKIAYESFNVMRVRLENAYSRPEGQSLLEEKVFEVAWL